MWDLVYLHNLLITRLWVLFRHHSVDNYFLLFIFGLYRFSYTLVVDVQIMNLPQVLVARWWSSRRVWINQLFNCNWTFAFDYLLGRVIMNQIFLRSQFSIIKFRKGTWYTILIILLEILAYFCILEWYSSWPSLIFAEVRLNKVTYLNLIWHLIQLGFIKIYFRGIINKHAHQVSIGSVYRARMVFLTWIHRSSIYFSVQIN